MPGSVAAQARDSGVSGMCSELHVTVAGLRLRHASRGLQLATGMIHGMKSMYTSFTPWLRAPILLLFMSCLTDSQSTVNLALSSPIS